MDMPGTIPSTFRSSGHVADSPLDDLLGRLARDVFPVKADFAAFDRAKACQRLGQFALAVARNTRKPHDFARAHAERKVI